MVQNIEILPPRSMQPWVERIWSLSGDMSGDPIPAKQLLPDGSVEILFSLGGSATVEKDGFQMHTASARVVGQLRSPLSIRLDGMLELVGIRCRPIGAAALLRVPMHELTGRISSLDDLVTDLPTERLADTTDTRTRLEIVTAWARSRLENATARCPIRLATEAIVSTGGRATVARIAHEACMSERQLERRFKLLVGMSPKSLARVTRFSRAFNLAQSVAAQTSVWAWPNVRIKVSVRVAVSISGARKMSR